MNRRPLLAGVRVVDLTRALAGPYGTLLLGDMGAEVIKVEERTGDGTRGGTPRLKAGDGSYFMSINRNKKSIALDLTSPEGKRVFDDLVRVSDVVYDNFRPKALKKLGCDYASVSKINPQIISCSVSGYGHTGDWQDNPSYDLVVQALGGAMSLTGEIGRPPVRMGIPMGDLAGGMFAALAISGALFQRSITGVGCEIDLALLDCQISLLTYLAQAYFITGEVPGPQGAGHMTIPIYSAFQTADGYIVVASPGERFWPKVCRAAGLEELIDDPRFIGRARQTEHLQLVRQIFQERFRTKTSAEWLTRLAEEDVPAAPINSIDKALMLPPVVQRDMVVEIDYPPTGQQIKMVGNPVKVAGVENQFAPPPILGQHTDEILHDLLGYPAAKVTELRQAGTVQ